MLQGRVAAGLLDVHHGLLALERVRLRIIVPYCWRKAFRDTSLSDEQEPEIVRLGITEVNKALTLNADYMEALVYKNILKRMQVNHTADTDQRARLIAEANGVRDRAEVLVGRR